MKKGINVLKRDLTIVAGIITTVDAALSDKKISFTEGIKIAFKSTTILEIVKTFKESRDEFNDLDGAEKQELANHFADKFDLRNDVAEKAVEDLLKFAISLADAFAVFGKK